MGEFLKEYLAEASQYTQELEHLLLELDKDPANEEIRREALRAAHNLKGISSYMGYEAIANLAHEMESILEKKETLDRGKEDLFVKLDHINNLLRKLHEGETLEISGGVPDERLSRLKALLEELREEDEDLYQAFVELLEEKVNLLSAILAEEEIDPSEVPAIREHLERIKSSARYLNLEEMVSFLEEFETELANLEGGRWRPYWETLTALLPRQESSPELEEFLSELSQEIEALSSLEVKGDEEASPPAEEVSTERAAPETSSGELQPRPEVSIREKRGEEGLPEIFLRVDADRMERLSSMVEELRSLGYRLQEIAGGARGYLPREWRLKLDEALLHLSTLTRSLSEEMQGLRLVPVDTLAIRVERLFRDLVKATGKEAELIFEGHDLRVDRVLLQEIWPALVHLMRNAFDHGLESAGEREGAGKPAKGRIVVSFETEQNWLKVTISDDGRGIDWDRVEKRARERGIQAESLEEVLFVPGFSTKEEADAVSGRGFGLDIVKQKVERLRGYVEISSRPGEGTRVSLYLPLGATLNRVILVRSGESLWAVPLYALREVRKLTASMLSQVGEEWIFNLHGESVSVLVPDKTTLEKPSFYLLLMSGRPPWGLAVSELLGQQEATLKPFAESLQALGPFLGLALLSGGGVAFVLDHRSLESLKRFLGQFKMISKNNNGH